MKHPKSITINGTDYNLEHLWPKNITIHLPAINNKPEVKVPILIFFSNHCISRGAKDEEDHHMTDHINKPRVFCPTRYELSLELLNTLENIYNKICLYNDRQGWLIVEYKKVDGTTFEYHIYFTIKKDRNKKNGLVMFINSAHIKDKTDNTPRFTNRKQRKRFTLIVRDILVR